MTRTTWIRGDTDVARAVALTTFVARDAGFDARRTNAVSTAASEVSRNIVKYAGSGQFSVNRIEDGERIGVQIVARDRGPGIADVPAALRDHYSTGGTLGLGLPGVKRLMDELIVDSQPSKGTTVTATLWGGEPAGPRRRVAGAAAVRRSPYARTRSLAAHPAGDGLSVEAAARLRPHRGERVSGDTAVLRWVGDLVLVALVDGLGHGPSAAAIAARADEALAAVTVTDVSAVIASVHEALRQTDGAAAAIAVIDPKDCSYRAAAVGNVRIRLMGSKDTRMEWTEGTLGARYRTPTPRTGRLAADTLLMYSDGISDRFELKDYPGVKADAPGIAARNVVERFGKDYDDASCLVLRCEA